MHRSRVLALAASIALLGVPAVIGETPAAAAPLTRTADPVVLTGADLPTLVNGVRTTIVGFRWTGSVWAQLPIQIDERAVVNFAKIYNNPSAVFYGSQPGLVNQLVYTSGNTWTGNDPDTKFDGNDELAFMARDAGALSPGGPQPPGTAVGSGVQLRITDPLAPGTEGYVYLYRRATGSVLSQGAGKHYVKYAFKLLAGGYKTAYQLTSGPNLENTLVTGASYRHHFVDRWASDRLEVTTGGATGVDILDRHKALFAPGTCVRSEDTFDAPGPFGSSEGAFVTNKLGSVRAIRSYVGANSGPNTQRTHVFYDRREDIRTDLRVHSIGSIMDFMDYSPAATGMTYRNEFNQGGLTIDGIPDTPAGGVPSWEQVTGPQGTINQVGTLTTTWTPASIVPYYLDDSTPATAQCTGDASAFGSSGVFINSTLPVTDPALGGTDRLSSTRTMYFEAPGGTAPDAIARRDQVLAPLTTVVNPAP